MFKQIIFSRPRLLSDKTYFFLPSADSFQSVFLAEDHVLTARKNYCYLSQKSANVQKLLFSLTNFALLLLKKTVQNLVDLVYHLAAEANVNRFFESPLFSNDVTASATLCVLEAARRRAVGRVLLASTEWVYGSIEDAGDGQITEETAVAQNPDHIYTSSKIASAPMAKPSPSNSKLLLA